MLLGTQSGNCRLVAKRHMAAHRATFVSALKTVVREASRVAPHAAVTLYPVAYWTPEIIKPRTPMVVGARRDARVKGFEGEIWLGNLELGESCIRETRASDCRHPQ